MRASSLVLITVLTATAFATAACQSKPRTAPSSPGSDSATTGAAAFTPDPNAPPPDPREAVLGPRLAELLHEGHLTQPIIGDDLSRRAFDELIDQIDPDRMLLLASHVEELRPHANRMDDELRAGNFEAGRVAVALLASRRKLVQTWIEKLLAAPLDHEDEETFETDPEKRVRATTDEELEQRWRQALELQVLERVARMEELAEARAKSKDKAPATPAEPLPATFEAREAKARAELLESYRARFSRMAQTNPMEAIGGFLNALSAALDPHTLYLPPADKANFDIEMSGSLEGIGAVLSEEDHYIIVREVVPGGAAWRQGKLQAGDLILAVAQDGKEAVDVLDMRIDEVVKMIRGPKDTRVTLTVKKTDGTLETITITRDVVEVESAFAKGATLQAGDRPRVGYIHLPSFYGPTAAQARAGAGRDSAGDTRALMEELRKQKVGGLILDLRSNGGGLLEASRDIAGLFIPTGPIVRMRMGEQVEALADDDASVAFDGPVVVLVDRFSASASGIVAGVLQDYGRAVIVGTGPTHGKGTVQMLLDLGGDELGILKLTRMQFFLVDGHSTQWRGVVPDILLPDPVAHIEAGERFLDNAVPWSSIEALPHTPWPAGRWTLPGLVAASAARVAKAPAFQRVAERIVILERLRDETVVPLKRETWMAQRRRTREELERLDGDLETGQAKLKVTQVGPENERVAKWRDELARDPWLIEATHVVADMVTAK